MPNPWVGTCELVQLRVALVVVVDDSGHLGLLAAMPARTGEKNN